MRYLYEMYPDAENRQQVADDLGMQIIFMILWGHQMLLLDKCKGYKL